MLLYLKESKETKMVEYSFLNKWILKINKTPTTRMVLPEGKKLLQYKV